MVTLETKLAHSKEDPVIEVIEKVKHTEKQGVQTDLQCFMCSI